MTVIPERLRPLLAADAPLQELAGRFASAGYRIYLVGGSLRDALLGQAPKDLDLTTDARPDEIERLVTGWAEHVWLQGKAFGTVGCSRGDLRLEITTFRAEVYHPESRKPSVTFADDLETDLSRRDFTVNAMAIELPDVALIDPFGGLDDLAQGRLRTPLSPEVAFGDDPLRMLRALRFASTLDFAIDPGVVAAIRELHGGLAIISAERIREEFSKLLGGRSPSAALALATEVGLAAEFIPELLLLRLEQDPIHRHKDVFAHTLAVLDNAIALETEGPDLVLRLAALLHDIGKPRTREFTSEGVTFHHHEVVGAEMAEARLRALRYPSHTIAEVRQLVYLHLRLHSYRLGWTDKAVRRYVRDAGALLDKLNTLVRSDCTTRNPRKAAQLSARIDELEARIRELAAQEELMALRPALNGNQVMEHLGIGPGRDVGRALDHLMEIRLDEGEIPEAEAFRRLDEWWAARQEGNEGSKEKGS